MICDTSEQFVIESVKITCKITKNILNLIIKFSLYYLLFNFILVNFEYRFYN